VATATVAGSNSNGIKGCSGGGGWSGIKTQLHPETLNHQEKNQSETGVEPAATRDGDDHGSSWCLKRISLISSIVLYSRSKPLIAEQRVTPQRRSGGLVRPGLAVAARRCGGPRKETGQPQSDPKP